MLNDQFYNYLFNPQYVNPNYYRQCQDHITHYQQEQNKEVQKVVKAIQDLCEAVKKLDPQHQQQAFALALSEMAKVFGWNR